MALVAHNNTGVHGQYAFDKKTIRIPVGQDKSIISCAASSGAHIIE